MTTVTVKTAKGKVQNGNRDLVDARNHERTLELIHILKGTEDKILAGIKWDENFKRELSELKTECYKHFKTEAMREALAEFSVNVTCHFTFSTVKNTLLTLPKEVSEFKWTTVVSALVQSGKDTESLTKTKNYCNNIIGVEETTRLFEKNLADFKVELLIERRIWKEQQTKQEETLGF